MLSFQFHPANTGVFIPMILVLVNARLETRAALFHPGRRFAAVCFDQALNIAKALAFGNHPRLSENSGGQLRNCRRPPSKSLIYPSHTSTLPESPDRRMIVTQNTYYQGPCKEEYKKSEREKSPPQRGVGGITKGQAVTYTLSDGKQIQKVTEVVTGTGSVVRAVSFLHR